MQTLTDTIINNIDLIIELISLVFIVTIIVLVTRLFDLFDILEDSLRGAVEDGDEYI